MITMRAYDGEIIDMITIYEGTDTWTIEKYAGGSYMVMKNGRIDSDYKNAERREIVKIGKENIGKKYSISLIRL